MDIRIGCKYYDTQRFDFSAQVIHCVNTPDLIQTTIRDRYDNNIVIYITVGDNDVDNDTRIICRQLSYDHKCYMELLQSYLDPLATLRL